MLIRFLNYHKTYSYWTNVYLFQFLSTITLIFLNIKRNYLLFLIINCKRKVICVSMKIDSQFDVYFFNTYIEHNFNNLKFIQYSVIIEHSNINQKYRFNSLIHHYYARSISCHFFAINPFCPHKNTNQT